MSLRSKHRPGWLVLGSAPVAAIALWAALTRSSMQDQVGARLHRALQSEDALSPGFEPLLRAAASRAASALGDPRTVRVNEPFDPASINLYVVRPGRLASASERPPPSFDDWTSFAALLENNLLAVPPATVVVDDYFLSMLLLNVHNDLLAITQAADPRTRGVEHDPRSVARNLGAISSYLRIRNFAHPREEDVTKLGAYAADLWVRMDIVDLVYPTLLPVIGHEIAHLQDADLTGTAPFRLPASANRLLARLTRSAEDRADREALAVASREVDRLFGSNDGTESGDPLRVIQRAQALISVGLYLRDAVVSDLFANFRGLDASDVATTILQRNCDELDEEEAKLPFGNPAVVEAAGLNELPLLTREEFDRMRNYIARSEAAESHAHNFLRAAEIVALVERHVPGVAAALTAHVGFLDALRANEPAKLEPSDLGAGMKLSRARILAHVDDWLFLEPAVNCRPGLCMIARAPDLDGWLEIVGPPDDVGRARLVFREAKAMKDREPLPLALLLRLMGNLFSDDETQGFRIGTQMWQELMNCPPAAVTFEHDSKHFSLRRINASDWYELNIWAAS